MRAVDAERPGWLRCPARKVRAEVELVGIDRRKLTFKVKVFDEAEQVGGAEHERFVIDVDKYTERLKKKIAG